MMGRFLAVVVVLAAMTLVNPVDAATIGWGCHEYGPPMDSQGDFLSGGALVQLIKAVGPIDPYLVRSTGTVDDVILSEVALGLPGMAPTSPPGIWFEGGVNVDIIPGDLLYARAYNVPPGEVETAPNLEVGIRNIEGVVVVNTVTQVAAPEDYFFDHIRTQPIPEPASLLIMLSGAAVWLLRKQR